MSNLLRKHANSSKSGRKSYTVGFKRASITLYYLLNENKSLTCRRMHIPCRKTLQKWVDDREIIFDPIIRINSRKVYTKRHKSIFPLADENVYKWFIDMREKHFKVTGEMLRNQMLEESKKMYPDDERVSIN